MTVIISSTEIKNKECDLYGHNLIWIGICTSQEGSTITQRCSRCFKLIEDFTPSDELKLYKINALRNNILNSFS